MIIHRRQFIKGLAGFFTNLFFLLSPLFNPIQKLWAKAKSILPKGTPREDLIDKNPAELDTRNLDITPLEAFETMGPTNHQVNIKTWRLQVSGHVRHPLGLSRDQIIALPFIEREVLLICPGFFANHGKWKGLDMGRLLNKVDVDMKATHVTFRGPEGDYENSQQYPIKDVISNKVFLAFGVNGNPLPIKHGFPLRVVAEGYYGYDWIKYVYKMTVEKVGN